ncbi:MAG: hypothetical protein IPP63_15900 [Chloracidobacterium sp.]|nr:hypothetical protein [Chloracidobacterium sp.]
MTESDDIQYLLRALELASDGKGLVSPNPLVGCVISSADGKVVGEGTYTLDGLVHAEAIALEQAGPDAIGGTAYVSLEPHDHHGKTPPCTEALINAGIRRVVCPIEDPNPLVSGRGFDHLRGVGIEVVVAPWRRRRQRSTRNLSSGISNSGRLYILKWRCRSMAGSRWIRASRPHFRGKMPAGAFKNSVTNTMRS